MRHRTALAVVAATTAASLALFLVRPRAEAAVAVGAPMLEARSYAMRVAPLALQSAGVMHFGPDGTLFLADSRAGAVYAIDVADADRDTSTTGVRIDDLDGKIAAALGTTRDKIRIVDMAVHPKSQELYFSLTRGRGDEAVPLVMRVTRIQEHMSVLPLESIRHARAALPDLPAADAKTPWGTPQRALAVTDLALVDGGLYVAGLSNEEFASTLRRIPYPFADEPVKQRATTVEIYHTSHGRYETAAPIESFLPITLAGRPSLLAGYGCSPIAAFTRAELADHKHVRGRTVAELGGGNRPLDMITYRGAAGREMILVANSDRTLMRLDPTQVAEAPALTTPVRQAFQPAGVGYLPISSFGVLQLDNLNAANVVVLQRTAEDGTLQVEPADEVDVTRRIVVGGALAVAALSGALGAAAWRGDAGLALVDTTAVEARGLGRNALRRLAADPGAFTLRVDASTGSDTTPPVLARMETSGGRARLVPRFPLARGVTYEARLALGAQRPLVLRFALPDERPAPRTRVVAVHPSADRVPANLLRWYVELSEPMEPGDALRHVHLLDEAGREVPRAFLALDEELWDPSRRRLTLLLDPGRVKRGVRTNDESGAPLVAGRRYHLVIDAGWRDGRGAPLRSGFERHFEAVDDDRRPLDVARWRVDAPAAASRAPLRVSFGEPLDHALASRMLRVQDAAGRAVAGTATLLPGDGAWQFVPDFPWVAGAYALRADAALEDVAGNSLARVFDADRGGGAPPAERGAAAGEWREVRFVVDGGSSKSVEGPGGLKKD